MEALQPDDHALGVPLVAGMPKSRGSRSAAASRYVRQGLKKPSVLDHIRPAICLLADTKNEAATGTLKEDI